MSENEAVTLAKQWVEREIGKMLPVISVYLMPETKANKENDYLFDMPASWMVVFQTDMPKYIEPNQIGIQINPETKEIRSMPL